MCSRLMRVVGWVVVGGMLAMGCMVDDAESPGTCREQCSKKERACRLLYADSSECSTRGQECRSSCKQRPTKKDNE
jgi:hypothetical protein